MSRALTNRIKKLEKASGPLQADPERLKWWKQWYVLCLRPKTEEEKREIELAAKAWVDRCARRGLEPTYAQFTRDAHEGERDELPPSPVS